MDEIHSRTTSVRSLSIGGNVQGHTVPLYASNPAIPHSPASHIATARMQLSTEQIPDGLSASARHISFFIPWIRLRALTRGSHRCHSPMAASVSQRNGPERSSLRASVALYFAPHVVARPGRCSYRFSDVGLMLTALFSGVQIDRHAQRYSAFEWYYQPYTRTAIKCFRAIRMCGGAVLLMGVVRPQSKRVLRCSMRSCNGVTRTAQKVTIDSDASSSHAFMHAVVAA